MEEKDGLGCIYTFVKLLIILFVFDLYYDMSLVKLWSDIYAHPIISAFVIIAWVFTIVYWARNLLK